MGKQNSHGTSGPAREAKCFKCQKLGSLCQSKQVSAMTDHSKPEDDDPFLGGVTSNLSTQWNATITVNNKQAQFKLDTGAEVTAISENTHCEFGKPELKRPSKTLYGSAGTSLGVRGQFNLSSKSAQATHVVYVVKGLKHNLLGLPAITLLDLVRRFH